MIAIDLRILLLLSILALTPLAYASPPDPAWVAGIYDEADLDDVIQLATSADGGLSSTLIEVSQPLLAPAGMWWLKGGPGAAAARRSPYSTRAPPLP
jgi:hypothetical protein